MYQRIGHSLNHLGLSQQSFLNSHRSQLPSHDRLTPLWSLVVLGTSSIRIILLDRCVIAHIAIRLGLDSHCIMFKVTVSLDSGVQIYGIVLEILRSIVA